jgi:hypothetical protein
MKFKAILLALLCALTFAPVAQAYTSVRSFGGVRSFSMPRVSTPRMSTPKAYTPKVTSPKPSKPFTAPYSGTKTKTIVHHDSVTSSPWFWMWLMNTNVNQPAVVSKPAAAPNTDDDSNLSEWIIGSVIILAVIFIPLMLI